MNIVVIIQARMSSTRLPGKVLMKIGRETMLETVVKRVNQTKLVNKVIVATSLDPSDDKIENLCKSKKISYFRGSLDNVLSRYFHAAKQENAQIVIRVTSDCPLVDPQLIDKGIKIFRKRNYDYVSNKMEPVFIRGFDYEIMTFAALKTAYQNADTESEKEHVTPYIWNTHPDQFKILKLQYTLVKNNYRLTVDTIEDMNLIRALVNKYQADEKTFMEIIDILDQHPELVAINAQIQHKQYKWVNQNYPKNLVEGL